MRVDSVRCDRRNDCGDSSDEQGCTYPPCQQHQFTCQNGRCISRDFICDGDNDCGDESDELDHMCRTPAPTCPSGNFMCDNGNCVPLSEVCDRSNDCNDNSDEKGCGEFYKSTIYKTFVGCVLISVCFCQASMNVPTHPCTTVTTTAPTHPPASSAPVARVTVSCLITKPATTWTSAPSHPACAVRCARTL